MSSSICSKILRIYRSYLSYLRRAVYWISENFAISLTLATAILYSIGYNFYMSYFSSLSLPYNSLDLPLTYYIDKLVVLIPGLFIGILILLILFILTDPACNKLINKGYTGECAKIIIYVIIILLFFLLITYYPHDRGEKFAKEFLEGKANNSFEINLTLKNGTNASIPEGLLLVIYNKDKYYMVQKNNSSSDDPILYIISSDQIDCVTTKRINPSSMFSKF